LQCGQARSLRIPLVPAYQDADTAEPGVEGAKTQVTGREIVLLVIERIVRNMHLAVKPKKATVRVQDGCGVVIDADRSFFEDRGDDNGLTIPGNRGKGVRSRTGNGLRQVKKCGILALAEIRGAKQFLQADYVGAGGRSLTDSGHGSRQVGFEVRSAAHLHQANADGFR